MSLKVTDFSYTLKKQHQKTVTKVILLILLYFVVINFILAFLIHPVRHVSDSMQPGVVQNSVVLVSNIVTTPVRGDVVLLKSRYDKNESFFKKALDCVCSFFTGQQIIPCEDPELPCTKNQIRRVVGIPGDTIYMRDYVLYVCPANEKHFLTEFELTSKKYSITFYAPPSDWDTTLGIAGNFEKIQLKDNEYFVLGDNRKSCDDSRVWGTVTLQDFAAKALLCYFPFNNFKLY